MTSLAFGSTKASRLDCQQQPAQMPDSTTALDEAWIALAVSSLNSNDRAPSSHVARNDAVPPNVDSDDDEDDPLAPFSPLRLDESLSSPPSLPPSRRTSCAEPGLAYLGYGLHIGAFREVCDPEMTVAAGVKGYLCVAREVTRPAHVPEGEAFLHLPLCDSATTHLQDYFTTAFNFIDDQVARGCPVVIYCQQGKSRSVSLALAYLMYKSQRTLDDLLTDMRCHYGRADPNVFFLAQLTEWEQGRQQQRTNATAL